MACTVHVAWDEGLTDYHFGPEHRLAPVRVELTMRLAHEFGLWDQPGVTLANPAPPSTRTCSWCTTRRTLAR
jgi:acetoin utilization protein AcuC